MESQCHQCGAVVAEGIAFCGNCGAAQIRVSGGSEIPATPPIPPGTPANIPPPAVPVAPGAGSGPVSDIQWGKAFPVTALAGAGVALLASIPLMHLGCCLWALAAGAGAVVLYRWRFEPTPWLSITAGVKLGAATGVWGSILYVIAFIALDRQREFRRAARQAIAEAASKNTDPAAQPTFDNLNTPEGIALVVTAFVAMMVVTILVFSVVGGGLGAAFTKPKTPIPTPSA